MSELESKEEQSIEEQSQDEQIRLLKEMIQEQKESQKIQKFILILLSAVVVCTVIACIVILPKVTEVMSTAYDTLIHINQLMDDIQPTLDGLNEFDYESLNQSLQQLKEAITSLNSVLSIFG